jgi:hypothetical protein
VEPAALADLGRHLQRHLRGALHTLFTNGQGIATGVIGSLGYWISQQEVARGGQPWYYYLLLVPLYEFLPLLLALPVVLAAFVQRNRVSLALGVLSLLLLAAWILLALNADAAERAGMIYKAVAGAAMAVILIAAGWGGLSRHPRNSQLFLAFLPFFILFSWVAYTIAGEKMPWLATSITMPMCIAGGWTLGRLVQRVDWRGLGWRAVWIAAAGDRPAGRAAGPGPQPALPGPRAGPAEPDRPMAGRAAGRRHRRRVLAWLFQRIDARQGCGWLG